MKAFSLIIRSLLSALCLFIATGCYQTQNQDFENNIQFDSLMVNKTYQIPRSKPNLCCSLQLKYVYPSEYEDKELLKKIQKSFIISFFINKKGNSPLEEVVDQYVADFIKTFESDHINYLEKDYLDQKDDSICYYNKTISNRIIYNQRKLISSVIYEEEDKGGAHNLHKYTNQVISLEKGSNVNEEDIFIEEFHDDLSLILKEMIALNNNLENAGELENIGFFVDDIAPNNNFYVDNDGITYTFNEYEIASYLVGTTSIQIPYEKIRHLLRRESPIASIAF